MKFIFLLLFLVLTACSTSEKKGVGRTALKLKIKYEDVALSQAGEWLGGTLKNPKYYTLTGSEIITPVFGVDVVPITKRSVDDSGRVLYPHSGYQVVGDLRLEHYLPLVKKVQGLAIPVKVYKPPVIMADSNFLEKGAVIKNSEGDVVKEYEFKALGWYLKK